MCKKGATCEFRHSEAARRNPRDCYYWMSWGCNKADCAFRHPPLGRPPGAAPPPAFPLAEDKSRTPCFFFARGAEGNGAVNSAGATGVKNRLAARLSGPAGNASAGSPGGASDGPSVGAAAVKVGEAAGAGRGGKGGFHRPRSLAEILAEKRKAQGTDAQLIRVAGASAARSAGERAQTTAVQNPANGSREAVHVTAGKAAGATAGKPAGATAGEAAGLFSGPRPLSELLKRKRASDDGAALVIERSWKDVEAEPQNGLLSIKQLIAGDASGSDGDMEVPDRASNLTAESGENAPQMSRPTEVSPQARDDDGAAISGSPSLTQRLSESVCGEEGAAAEAWSGGTVEASGDEKRREEESVVSTSVDAPPAVSVSEEAGNMNNGGNGKNGEQAATAETVGATESDRDVATQALQSESELAFKKMSLDPNAAEFTPSFAPSPSAIVATPFVPDYTPLNSTAAAVVSDATAGASSAASSASFVVPPLIPPLVTSSTIPAVNFNRPFPAISQVVPIGPRRSSPVPPRGNGRWECGWSGRGERHVRGRQGGGSRSSSSGSSKHGSMEDVASQAPLPTHAGFRAPYMGYEMGETLVPPPPPMPPTPLATAEDRVSRAILLSLLPAPEQLPDAVMSQEIERTWGPLRFLDLSRRREGVAMAHFFDLRHAKAALRDIQQQHWLQQQRTHHRILLRLRQIHARETPEKTIQDPYRPLPNEPVPLKGLGLVAGWVVWAQAVEPDGEGGAWAGEGKVAEHGRGFGGGVEGRFGAVQQRHQQQKSQQQQQQQQLLSQQVQHMQGGLWQGANEQQGGPWDGGNGCIMVRNIDPSVSMDSLRALFTTCGDVKEVRAVPSQKLHRLVEFFDIRAAAHALQKLTGTELAGRRIKMEFAREGLMKEAVGAAGAGGVVRAGTLGAVGSRAAEAWQGSRPREFLAPPRICRALQRIDCQQQLVALAQARARPAQP
ncbi:unnamed protein product [Closterium sp. Yama58-4]|nr:unnamed protein product [Closterium sp. Yama58-4]